MSADGRIWFHVARRNRIADQLDGGRALISVSGREGYQSANWYVSEDQVPTWHYEAVEIEGAVRQLADEELIALVDQLLGHDGKPLFARKALDARQDGAGQVRSHDEGDRRL